MDSTQKSVEALAALDHSNFVNALAEKHELVVLREFFSKCSAHAAALIVDASKKTATQSSKMAGEVLLKLENAQMIEPRGRFDVSIGEGGILLDGKTGSCFFTWASISHVSVVPSSVCAKKEGEDLIALRSKEGISFNGKIITNMMLTLSKSGKSISSTIKGCKMEGLESEVVPTVVAAIWNGQIATPKKELFVCVNGKTLFMRCYKVSFEIKRFFEMSRTFRNPFRTLYFTFRYFTCSGNTRRGVVSS